MLALVDSGLANLFSVEAALQRLGVEAVRTDDPALLAKADRVILPGVGAAGPAMEGLRAKGLVRTLRALSVPVLGICLGMQLMFERSEEGGDTPCLGIFPGTVRRLPEGPEGPVPHMGWNTITLRDAAHPLLHGVKDESSVYFVHSFAADVSDISIASCRYTAPFTAVAARGAFMGCQFHPERSGPIGSLILKNFLEL